MCDPFHLIRLVTNAQHRPLKFDIDWDQTSLIDYNNWIDKAAEM